MFVTLDAVSKIIISFVLLKQRIVLVWCCREISWLIFGAANQQVTHSVLQIKQVI
jgi:hypothetical protein